jgi:hypothetical protein
MGPFFKKKKKKPNKWGVARHRDTAAQGFLAFSSSPRGTGSYRPIRNMESFKLAVAFPLGSAPFAGCVLSKRSVGYTFCHHDLVSTLPRSAQGFLLVGRGWSAASARVTEVSKPKSPLDFRFVFCHFELIGQAGAALFSS